MRKILFAVVCWAVTAHAEYHEWSEFSAILQPSSIDGLGVFATHDIKAGSPVFARDDLLKVVKKEVVHSEFLKFCNDLNDNYCVAPERFDRLEIICFLNHSLTPNIVEDSMGAWVASCEIKEGEELLINYNKLGEAEFYKDPFYNE